MLAPATLIKVLKPNGTLMKIEFVLGELRGGEAGTR